MARTTRLELATSAVTEHHYLVTARNYAARMATKVALRNREEQIMAKLKADGLQTTDAPEIGRDGKWSFDIYDPDFTRVEFMEFKPVKEPCCNPYTAEHPKP